VGSPDGSPNFGRAFAELSQIQGLAELVYNHCPHLPSPGGVVNGDFRVGTWLVQPGLNTISQNGTKRQLEPKVMEVLVCLAHHPGETLPKEQLLKAVWPDTFVSDDVLVRCISEIRRAVEDDARESKFVQTIPKRGYRLLAPVEPVSGCLEGVYGQRSNFCGTWFATRHRDWDHGHACAPNSACPGADQHVAKACRQG